MIEKLLRGRNQFVQGKMSPKKPVFTKHLLEQRNTRR